jgi:hypothetical protein
MVIDNNSHINVTKLSYGLAKFSISGSLITFGSKIGWFSFGLFFKSLNI